MAETIAEQPVATNEGGIEKEKPKPSKTKKSSGQAARKPVGKTAEGTARRIGKYTDQERRVKLNAIDDMVRSGTHNLKAAVKEMGIGDQTYYNWRKALATPDALNEELAADHGPAGADTFQDLVRLEEENNRLRKALAEKLHAENAELKKKLGLD